MHFSKICKFLAGSFSAVSKRNFSRKYAFDSIFQALQDLHTFAPLQSQNFSKNRFEKSAIFMKIQQHFCKSCCKKKKIRQNRWALSDGPEPTHRSAPASARSPLRAMGRIRRGDRFGRILRPFSRWAVLKVELSYFVTP